MKRMWLKALDLPVSGRISCRDSPARRITGESEREIAIGASFLLFLHDVFYPQCTIWSGWFGFAEQDFDFVFCEWFWVAIVSSQCGCAARKHSAAPFCALLIGTPADWYLVLLFESWSLAER